MATFLILFAGPRAKMVEFGARCESANVTATLDGHRLTVRVDAGTKEEAVRVLVDSLGLKETEITPASIIKA